MPAINESPASIGVEARPFLPYNPQTAAPAAPMAQPINMGPSMIGRYTPSQYSPVANQFPSLLSPQPMNNYSGNYGVNRFTGLLGSPLNFNAPTGTMSSYSTNTYQPSQMTNQQQYLNSWTPSTLFRQMSYSDSPQLQLFGRLAPFAEQVPYTRTTF